MKLYVKYREVTTSSYFEDKAYGDWNETRNFSLLGVCLEKPERVAQYEEFEVSPNIEADVGNTAVVLYMIYSTGDSFGHGTGYGEILWVFPDGASAVAAMRAVQKQENEYTLEFDDGFGNIIKLSNPAAGYFEDLTLVDTETFKITRT